MNIKKFDDLKKANCNFKKRLLSQFTLVTAECFIREVILTDNVTTHGLPKIIVILWTP